MDLLCPQNYNITLNNITINHDNNLIILYIYNKAVLTQCTDNILLNPHPLLDFLFVSVVFSAISQ
jgi:hypothetical protein